MDKHNQLPRELEDGLYWLGGCLEVKFSSLWEMSNLGESQEGHNHISCYLIKGSEKSILIDCGHPKDWDAIISSIESILQDRKLDYIFPTHGEVAHAGNIPRLISKFPESQIIGDLRDYHLFFPEYKEHFVTKKPGDSIDLGDTHFIFIDPVLKDLPNTLWAYDTKRQVLFCADGLGSSHGHKAGECALTFEELPKLPNEGDLSNIAKLTFYWARLVNMEPYYYELENLLKKFPTRILAPAHGNVVTDIDSVLPIFKRSMTQR